MRLINCERSDVTATEKARRPPMIATFSLYISGTSNFTFHFLLDSSPGSRIMMRATLVCTAALALASGCAADVLWNDVCSQPDVKGSKWCDKAAPVKVNALLVTHVECGTEECGMPCSQLGQRSDTDHSSAWATPPARRASRRMLLATLHLVWPGGKES
jgi:hypothetical protein